MKITGTHISYYFHCKRHLWFFIKNIQMEFLNEDVAIGRFISETAFERKEHELHLESIDADFVIDFYDKKNNTVHEIKKSNRFEEIHIWQVKYYLMKMEELGIRNLKGIINYPKLKLRVPVTLSEDDKREIQNAIVDIKILSYTKNPPPVINKPFCKKCSYYELCYI